MVVHFADNKHIQTEIPRERHKELRKFCLDHELTLNTLLSQIVTEWIKTNIKSKEEEKRWQRKK